MESVIIIPNRRMIICQQDKQTTSNLPSGVCESCSEMPLTTMPLTPVFSSSAEVVLTGSVVTTKKSQR